jgi:hypothetical protein
MADSPNSTTPVAEGGARKSNKITQFLKKNKTLTAVAAVGGLYYLVKHGKSGNGEESEAAPEYNAEGATPLNEMNSVNVREEYNELTAEERQRRSEEDTATRERLREEEEQLREREAEKREESAGNEKEPEAPGSGNTPEEPAPSEHGVSIHGKDFAGATSSRIVGPGKVGNKQYIEYVITFPGRQERWQYFTATGNWRKANTTGGGSTTGGNGTGTGTGGSSNGGGGGSSGGSQPKIGISPGKALPAPSKPAPQPAPPRAPTCDPGTVGNILHARAEVQRLQGEITSLQANKPKGWAANVAGKQATRDQFQGTVDRGRQQPGCGNV